MVLVHTYTSIYALSASYVTVQYQHGVRAKCMAVMITKLMHNIKLNL
jgi:hypothetical protein